MFRRIVCIFSVAGCLIVFGIPVLAAEGSGSIRVLPSQGIVQIALYRIGSLTADSCRITDGLADWIVSRQEIQTEDFLQWALSQSWKNKWICAASGQKGAKFEDLEEGLYLVKQAETASGGCAFDPFLVTLSEETDMDLVITMGTEYGSEIPKTGDYPAPIFLAMVISFGVVVFMVLAENRKK